MNDLITCANCRDKGKTVLLPLEQMKEHLHNHTAERLS